MELKKYKLADIAKIEISGVDKKTIEGETPVRLCNFVDVYYNWAITKDKAKRFMIASAKQSEIDRFSIGKGMVAITKDSETKYDIGVATYIADNFDNVVLGYHCALITPNPTIVDGKYLNAFMHTQYIQKYFENNASGSGQRYTLSNDTISNIPVLLPPMEVQRTIGKLLADLDRKIELNRQINDNLEAMARQLYDYWFVQFDFPNEEGKPYKSSGGAMVWNEKLKREIPEEWKTANVFDELSVQYGFPFSTELFTEEPTNIPVVRIRDILENSVSAYSEEEVDEKYKLQKQDLLVGMDGNFHMNYWNDNVSYLNQRSVRLRAKSKSTVSIMQAKYDIAPYIKAKELRAKGSTVGHLSDKDLKELFVLVSPNADFRNKFDSILAEIIENRCEMIELTKQRDELLPLLMNGQASVNYHLSASFHSSFILYRDQYKFYDMKETIIQAVLDGMRAVLTDNQLDLLTDVTRKALSECEITPKLAEEEQRNKENAELLGAFISSKKVEGCSDKTIHYYKSSIEKLIASVKKNVCDIATNDIRCYLAEQQEQRGLSKVTIDNLRRIFSSFFSWLEDEDYITKSPVRRIHKVRTDALVKEVLTDENIEVLRDSCQEMRDVAMIDLLLSTGMRVGELVKINRDDIDFQERQCVVFGKGNKEREVYFNARTKIHLKKYLEQRTDTNPALFVSLHEPHTRLTISGVEVRLRQLGKRVNLHKVHPHKFRRTLATMAIDKGMPIEQVQKMLGHVKIDTTLHYAMVNQANVKAAHRKFLN